MPATIVLFVYNRPEHTRQTVEALARNLLAKESELWIFSDAAKDLDSADRVAAVRAYVNSLAARNWFSNVHVLEAEQNRGLAKSVITGVTQVIDMFGSAIVMEDDLVTAPDFLTFMNACLEFYRDNDKIGSISGYSAPVKIPEDYKDSVYIISRSCSYGWATWADRWQQVDWDVSDFKEFKKDIKARNRFDECGSDRYNRLRRQIESNINSWSVRFGYWQFRHGANTVYPVVSRVRNIGTDGSGVHDSTGAIYNNVIPDSPVPFILSIPEPDKRIIRQTKKIYSGSSISCISRFLRNNGFEPIDTLCRKMLKRG